MMPAGVTTTTLPFSRLMVSTLPRPGTVDARRDPEQRAVAVLDDGAAIVVIAEPPAFGDLGLRLLLRRHRAGDVRRGGGRRRRGLLRAAIEAVEALLNLGELGGRLGLRLLGAVEPLGELAELRAGAALDAGDAGLERRQLAAELGDAGLQGVAGLAPWREAARCRAAGPRWRRRRRWRRAAAAKAMRGGEGR